jgi:23S rRNA (uracil1939-C5)-methyltransferase
MDQLVVVRVTDLSRGGAGVSRGEDGRVIFVPLTAAGDLVKVRIIEENKRYAQAELVEVLEPSLVRQAPRCPAFGKCGGCQWQHLPYDLQWKTKAEGVRHALTRVHVPSPAQFEEIPATQIWEYRNRVQLRGDGGLLGFHRAGTREIVDIQRCDIAHSKINETWDEIRSEGKKFSKPFKVEVEVLPDGSLRKLWNSRHSAGGFRQVHDEQNERLKHWISSAFGEGEVLYDLFGGSGNLCIPLVEKYPTIHCVDLGSPQVRPEGVSERITFHRSPVLNWLLREAGGVQAQSEKKAVRAAILDPPREGLGEDFALIARAVEELGVSELVAVGCDPDAWSRDVSRWVKRGWRLERAMVIDLFPQTPHIESVGFLKR